MESTLSKTQFKQRLVEVTSSEEGAFFITSYNFSGTPFCGTHDDSSFVLTRNSFLVNVKSIVIEGAYTETHQKTTEVNYSLRLPRYQGVLYIILNVIAFFGINLAILWNSKTEIPWMILATANGFLIFMNLWGYVIHLISRRLVDQRFRDVFEIGRNDG